VFDPVTEKFTFFSLTHNMEQVDNVLNCTNDGNGNVWLLRNGSLMVSQPIDSRLQLVKLQDVDKKNYIIPGEPRGVYFDKKESRYYFAVRHSLGVFVYDTSFKFLKLIPTPLFTNYYTNNRTCTDHITRDGSGRLWVTGWETYVLPPGSDKFDHAGKLYKKLSWLNKRGEFISLLSDKAGNILLQERQTGNIFIIDHKTFSVDTLKLPKAQHSSVYTIGDQHLCYDSVKNLLYYGSSNALFQYDLKSKRNREVPLEDSVGQKDRAGITYMYDIDLKGRIWVLQEKAGLRVIDSYSFKKINTIELGVNGLFATNYSGLVCGPEGYVYLMGANVIVLYNYLVKKSVVFDNTNGLYIPSAISVMNANNRLIIGHKGHINYYDLGNFIKSSFGLIPRIQTWVSLPGDIYGDFSINDGARLRHNDNDITFSFSVPEFIFPERVEYAYKVDGVDRNWRYTSFLQHKFTYYNLNPGTYVIQVKAQYQGGSWEAPVSKFTFTVKNPYWKEWWFISFVIILVVGLVYFAYKIRINTVRKTEQNRLRHEMVIRDMEAQALRAQMNPHFIFNCLNSIKVLIQDKENEKGILYLTTFSKLIRTLFNNADKKEITLFDEVETCKYYLQLESMRFDSRFAYMVNIDPQIDLKSVTVPALVIQPFIENAIWHGIMPRAKGGTVTLSVRNINKTVQIEIDDNGIGREASRQNKNSSGAEHQSKGVGLTEARLKLDNLLNQRDAQIKITDKKDIHGEPLGTNVLIILNEE